MERQIGSGAHPELGQYPPDIYRLLAEQGRDGERIRYDLSEHTLQHLTHLPGDTVSDDTRIEQIRALEDDIESLDDNDYYKKRQEGHHEHMMEEYSHSASTERQQRRDERLQGRYRGTKKELEEMRDSLLAIT
eukprot:336019-Amphidinium_carterae.1